MTHIEALEKERSNAETDKAQRKVHNTQLTTELVDFETEKARSEARLHAQLEDIRKRMDAFIRRLFGRKTERITVNPLRLLDDHALATAAQAVEDDKPEPEPEPSTPRTRRKKERGGGRRALPEHHERIEVASKETGPTECGGCGGPMTVIGADRSERLDSIPATVRVQVTVREKRACACCPERGIVTQGTDRSPFPEDGVPTTSS